MGKYIYLQFKRVLRTLPFVFIVVLILFASLMTVFGAFTKMSAESEEKSKFEIAIVGDAEDSYLNLSIKAVQSFDSSRFAIDILQLSEEEAVRRLEKGTIAAYVVIPDGFVDAAIRGEVMTLKYVSTVGSTGLVSMFKDEITTVISNMSAWNVRH